VKSTEDHSIYFVYLNGDRLYTVENKTLYVYSLSDLSSPIATYPHLRGQSYYSCIITDNRLYLGGGRGLHIFEVNNSSTQPLKRVTVIDTCGWPKKILRLGDELLLGEDTGYLQVFDI
jgi:hypothetical protein